jgi:hypothetical protein
MHATGFSSENIGHFHISAIFWGLHFLGVHIIYGFYASLCVYETFCILLAHTKNNRFDLETRNTKYDKNQLFQRVGEMQACSLIFARKSGALSYFSYFLGIHFFGCSY